MESFHLGQNARPNPIIVIMEMFLIVAIDRFGCVVCWTVFHTLAINIEVHQTIRPSDFSYLSWRDNDQKDLSHSTNTQSGKSAPSENAPSRAAFARLPCARLPVGEHNAPSRARAEGERDQSFPLRLNSDRPTKRKPPEGGLFSTLSVSDRGQNQPTQSAPGWPHILVDTARVFTVVIRPSPP